jgi:hypothetical protein
VSFIARYEWLWLELLVVAALGVELYRTRRAIRRDREKAKQGGK